MAAAKKKTIYSFHTRLKYVPTGFIHTVIEIPDEVKDQLPKGRLRAKGTFNKTPFALGILHRKDGAWYFSVSAGMRKEIGIESGDPVNVSFHLVDPEIVEVPEELQAVLDQDDEARKAWDELTFGYRRSLIHYVTSVKNVDSRIKRAIELLDKAKYGLLYGQQIKKAKKK